MAGPTTRRSTRTSSRSARLNRALDVVNVDATASSFRSDRGLADRLPLGARRQRSDLRSVRSVRRRSVGRVDQLSERVRRHPGQHVRADRELNFTGRSANMGIEVPWAEDGVGVNVGARISQGIARPQSRTSRSRPAISTGQGAPTLPVNGNFRVWEVLRRSPDADRPEQLHRRADARAPAIASPGTSSSNDRKYDTDTYKLSARVRADPRCPVPRFVQPGGSCAEHPGAVRSAVRRSRRRERSVRQVTSSGRPTSAVSHRACRSDRSPSRTRPASITACSAATRTSTPEKATTKTARRRSPAALHPALRADGRLVEHRAEERDPGLRRGRDPQRPASTNSTATSVVAGLRPDPSRPGRLDLADARTASSIDTPNKHGDDQDRGFDVNSSLLASAVQHRQALAELHRNLDAQGLQGR